MEWLVIDVIYMRTTEHYGLFLNADSLKIIAEVISEHPIQSGDILCPVMDAMYQVNRNEKQCLKVISATAFFASRWVALNRRSGHQRITAVQTVL